jgi:hypothetical protein
MDNIDLITDQLKRLARQHPEISIGKLLEDVLPDDRTPESLLIFKEELDNMSTDARSVCRVIFSLPHKAVGPNGKGWLKKRLRLMSWGKPRIFSAFREIKKIVNGNGKSIV